MISILYRFIFILLCINISYADDFEKKDDIWKSIAPGFSNVVSNAIIKEKDILLLIDIGGLIKYNIKNKTWKYLTKIKEGGITTRRFFDFDVSPTNNKFIVLAGDGLFFSKNNGDNWHKVKKGLPSSQYGKRINSYGQVKFNSDGSRIFSAIGTKPFMPIKHIESKLRDYHKKKYIYVSNTDATSFTKLLIDDTKFAIIKKIYPHPTNPNILYLSFNDGSFYITLNAKDDSEKIKFHKINLQNNFYVKDIIISKLTPSNMFLILESLDKNKKSNLMYSENALDYNLKLNSLPIKFSADYLKYQIIKKQFMSINFETKKENNLVIGLSKNTNILRYKLINNKIELITLPKKEYKGLGKFYGSIERVFRGDNDTKVIVSKTGTWISYDNFKTFKNLLMVNYNNGYYGNTGIGAIANVDTLNITKKYIYAGTYDHSAWRFDINSDKAYSLKRTVPKSLRNGKFSWLGTNIYVSEDNKYIIMEDDKRSNKYPGHHMNQDKKFLLSKDNTESWIDITENLNKGVIFAGGSKLIKIIFNKTNSSKQWWLFSNELFYTDNGAQTFKLLKTIKDKLNKKIYFSDIIHDKNNLYLSYALYDRDINSKFIYPKDLSSIIFSSNNGQNWTKYETKQKSVKSLSILNDSTLIIGTMKSFNQSGKLIIIPDRKQFQPSHIKMELGLKEEEMLSNQTSFWPIISDGDNILVYSNINWVLNDNFFAKGPYLSLDKGKTFQDVTFNLPNTNIYSVAMLNNTIVLGTTLGIMRANIDDIKRNIQTINKD